MTTLDAELRRLRDELEQVADLGDLDAVEAAITTLIVAQIRHARAIGRAA